MEVDGKSVQVAYVQWTEVGMKGIVKQSIMHSEVYRKLIFGAACRVLLRLGGSLTGRFWLLRRIGKWRLRIRRGIVGSEVKPICVEFRCEFYSDPRHPYTMKTGSDSPWMYSTTCSGLHEGDGILFIRARNNGSATAREYRRSQKGC
jgi:hypothetical protein